jgi:hypothetical protein
MSLGKQAKTLSKGQIEATLGSWPTLGIPTETESFSCSRSKPVSEQKK